MDTESIVATVATGLILLQLVFMHLSFRAEYERRAKQSTVEYMNKIRVLYRPIVRELERRFPGKRRVINLSEIDE